MTTTAERLDRLRETVRLHRDVTDSYENAERLYVEAARLRGVADEQRRKALVGRAGGR